MFRTKVALRLATRASHVYARPQSRIASVSPNAVSSAQRHYATPGRPKTAVGEPSKTVKRAVKRTAADDTAGVTAEDAAGTTKSPKAKAKAKSPRPKKELTEEEKAKQAERAEKAAARKAEKEQKTILAELKTQALSPPRLSYPSAWSVYNGEKMQRHDSDKEGAYTKAVFAEGIRERSRAFKSLSAAELEHYNHLSAENKKKASQEYQDWVKSHTPEQIRLANEARLKLRSRLEPRKARAFPPIRDDRLIKRATTPYAFFTKERHASGDLRNIEFAETSPLISREWKALSENEKQKYHDLFAQDSQRYLDEYQQTYGHLPPGAKKKEKGSVEA